VVLEVSLHTDKVMNAEGSVRRDWAGAKSADERQAVTHLLAQHVTENFSAAGVRPGVSERVTSFGPFRLLSMQRLLLEGDRPVRLGSRAFDLLLALVERPGDLVSKRELMARVWPDTLVEEGNLKVHISALRRALADGKGGNRYVANIPGRGYRFVAPVTVVNESRPKWSLAAEPNGRHNLPARLTRLVGRADSVAMLAALSLQQRLLTIVGTGGIGKTSVALAVAEGLAAKFEHGVWLADVALVDEPNLLPTALAVSLGIEIDPAMPMTCLIKFLRDKQLLLVLDNCERVVGATAALAISILKGAPGVHVLATSREPLGAEGEQVHRLRPLETPANWQPATLAEALGFPAVKLFIERASLAGQAVLKDSDAPIIADICRKLDGIALAIELSAARVEVLGIHGLASRLDDHFQLITGGRRTGVARHQSMSANFDWSYDLLTASEQMVLRRLAIFDHSFTLHAAAAIAADAHDTPSHVVDLVIKLAAKSLITPDADATEPRFRLLETTRAFALKKLIESGELKLVGEHHATFHRKELAAA
jgi:predicted ATPase/DNA-binding winged helix-turn-helix (wHTH) protein